jgi:hypothetical protein
MRVAFTKEDSAGTASETLLPDRPVSLHPNLVTGAGLKVLEFQLQQAREAYETTAVHSINRGNTSRRASVTRRLQASACMDGRRNWPTDIWI